MEADAIHSWSRSLSFWHKLWSCSPSLTTMAASYSLAACPMHVRTPWTSLSPHHSLPGLFVRDGDAHPEFTPTRLAPRLCRIQHASQSCFICQISCCCCFRGILSGFPPAICGCESLLAFRRSCHRERALLPRQLSLCTPSKFHHLVLASDRGKIRLGGVHHMEIMESWNAFHSLPFWSLAESNSHFRRQY
jgi:hypothetical protein